MSRMKSSVERLLDIYAPTGQEKPVRDYLKPLLGELMDDVEVDVKGNLLASKRYGEGATVMFSAHMDTISHIEKDKVVLETFGVYTAILPNGEKTVLGADDRAGIAIILEALESIPESFRGTIKVAFTVEEETGRNGSKAIAGDFLEGVDLSIVVDRRGSRDIVTDCFIPFCSLNTQLFVVDASHEVGMVWECVSGGISDAVVFAQRGINSINLSAGYYYEHTEKEMLILKDMEDTVVFIQSILRNINDSYQNLGNVPQPEDSQELEDWDDIDSLFY